MTTMPESPRGAFSPPLRWYLLECAHYGAQPTRGRQPDGLVCEICERTRRVVQPVDDRK